MILMVKGDRYTAARAAAAHRIPAAFVRERDGVTTQECPDSHIDLVRRWYSEDPGTAPFPPGALLFYTDDKAAARELVR